MGHGKSRLLPRKNLASHPINGLLRVLKSLEMPTQPPSLKYLEEGWIKISAETVIANDTNEFE